MHIFFASTLNLVTTFQFHVTQFLLHFLHRRLLPENNVVVQRGQIILVLLKSFQTFGYLVVILGNRFPVSVQPERSYQEHLSLLLISPNRFQLDHEERYVAV